MAEIIYHKTFVCSRFTEDSQPNVHDEQRKEQSRRKQKKSNPLVLIKQKKKIILIWTKLIKHKNIYICFL